ncbi:hypothetical protein ASPACDRAFT_1908436 [Aspergillus aculeatus ATCC 16872]|uniref:Protein kinase domain-containing protein n=1 Tax=Aspergillus aculeatus (strain ATCC 16872 / CBS 172.66 / WB 5094) TaxID=690307 RepID=A0A1L9WG06_ASPA1|nr:uncharacterized protein ASPACDRAFT_1908436 [Aspergillus aculeatus ATCC 16872]OJJ95111.1 hypothetical protein ASPACDRAFT_1908436 [Aspergillus aculeatus ATCC 16872]
MWSFNLEGRVITLGGRKLRIQEQLTEVLDLELGERSLLLKARNLESQALSLIRMRYQLDPRGFEMDTEEAKREVREIAENEFLHECDVIKLLGDAGLGPRYADHFMCWQPSWMPFPGGYGHFLVMAVPPGENLDEINDELTDRQLDGILTQLARILELLRKNGHRLIDQHPSYLNYDVGTKKLYLVDLTHLRGTDPASKTSFPIDEESPYVETFNIWRAPYRKPQERPKEASKAPPRSGDKSAGKKSSDQPTKKENRPPWRP